MALRSSCAPFKFVEVGIGFGGSFGVGAMTFFASRLRRTSARSFSSWFLSCSNLSLASASVVFVIRKFLSLFCVSFLWDNRGLILPLRVSLFKGRSIEGETFPPPWRAASTSLSKFLRTSLEGQKHRHCLWIQQFLLQARGLASQIVGGQFVVLRALILINVAIAIVGLAMALVRASVSLSCWRTSSSWSLTRRRLESALSSLLEASLNLLLSSFKSDSNFLAFLVPSTRFGPSRDRFGPFWGFW